mgnify:CR=1 FL=1
MIAIKFKKDQEDEMHCLRTVTDEDEVLVITSRGIIVRQQVGDIPSQGRAATGVVVQRVDLDNGDYISSVSIVPSYDESDDDQSFE